MLRPGDPTASKDLKGDPLPATREVVANVSTRLTQLGGPAPTDGKLVLVIEATYGPPTKPQSAQSPERITIEIPLASTTEAYGESRSCGISSEGVRNFTYVAGLDEQNFMAFSPTGKVREFRFLVNKYLCRALAASYSCTSAAGSAPHEAKPSKDMRYWSVGTYLDVRLESKNADARAEVTPIHLTGTGKPFDYAQCEKIAPSNGLCCVAGKTTEWHCGGLPLGQGWHQVSGSCFHRETGGSCKE